MGKKLEEIKWDGENYINEKGEKVEPKSLSEPRSLSLGIGEELRFKRVHEYINNNIPKTSKLYLEVNAYCVGTPTNNDNGRPVQFSKI